MRTSTPCPKAALRAPRLPQSADEHALRARPDRASPGGGPSALDEHRDGAAQRRLHLRGTFELDAETGCLHHAFDAFGQRRHVVPASTCSTNSRCSAGIILRGRRNRTSRLLPTKRSGIAVDAVGFAVDVRRST
jgi:hypothetical protein